jgi:hypothetical protein
MNRPSRAATSLLAHATKETGRFLLVLAAVELLSMPLTQYAWNWDHFLQGGTDFESSLLFLVICLGLLLVLGDHRRNDEDLRLPWWRLSLPNFDPDKSIAQFGIGIPLSFHREPAGLNLMTYNAPLQI